MSTFSSRLSRTFTKGSLSSIGDEPQRTPPQTMKGFDKLRDELRKHLPFASDVSTIESVIDGIAHLNSIDDRKMLLEHTLVYLSNNSEHPAAKKLESILIKMLYEDLPHPPDTSIGPTYAYRSVDGSNNNPCIPDLGKAGTPYSRSVQQTHPLPRNELPDAGLVFDTLLRREKFQPHPAGLSSLMFAFAALVIHTVFRTSHKDVHVNETSSYVDLAPLYGNNQEAQDKIRVRDGRGLLVADTFAEDRLMLLPPAVCVLLTLFNRNHNYIAGKLLELNERGTYVDPCTIPSSDYDRASKLLTQEEDIFQTARLINCGWFAGIVMSDYFAAILGLVRQGNSWAFNPFEEMRNADHALFERGRGNSCSVEASFNCLYRWHPTTSKADEGWVERMNEKFFPGKAIESLTIQDFRALVPKLQAMEPDPSHWTFGSLARDSQTGAFGDEALAAVLIAATEEPAGAFGARGTPHCMRLHEIMGIEQNRQWGVCSLNDFRQATYSSFLEWNPNPEIASAAEKLYGHIDRLELYVGLQAEETKPVIEGAGLCPGYTISRAILSDAIALTRGDRFYTADFTPFNMTAWGFADCQREAAGPGCGSMLGRLLLRTLPHQFAPDSSYAWFPLMTPVAMERVLTRLGQAELYNLEKPTTLAEPACLAGYEDVKAVLKDEQNFGTSFAQRVKHLVKGDGFFIASHNPAQAAREQRELLSALTGAPGAEASIRSFFYEKTRELIQSESCHSVGTSTHTVDLVRDVLKCVPIYWAADLAGIRLKKNADGEGDYTPTELFDVLADVYSYLFLDVEPGRVHKLRQQAVKGVEKLSNIIRRQLGGSRLSIINLFSSVFGKASKGDSERASFVERLKALGQDTDTQVNVILALLVGSTVELSQAAVNVVNFYLDPTKPNDVQALVAKSASLNAKDEAVLQGFVLEALRLDPTFRGVYREVLRDVKLINGPLKAKTRVFIDLSAANLSSYIFNDPEDVNPARGFDKYLVIDGAGKCIGLDLSSKMITEMVRAVYSFKGATRGPGVCGQLKRYKETSSRTSSWSYLGPDQHLQPWATSMLFQYQA